MPVVVDPAEAVLALRGGGRPGAVLHHEAGAELVQEPGGRQSCPLSLVGTSSYCTLIGWDASCHKEKRTQLKVPKANESGRICLGARLMSEKSAAATQTRTRDTAKTLIADTLIE